MATEARSRCGTPDAAPAHEHPAYLSSCRAFASDEDGMVHLRPLRDDTGEIIDAELVAWNRAFVRDIEPRLGRQPTVGTLLSDYAGNLTYSLAHLSEAVASGRSVQIIPVFDTHRHVDRPSGPWRLLWRRLDDTILVQATDLTEYQVLQEHLADQRALVALSVNARVLAEERERIARNLHDSVIQCLYAASLELEMLSMDGAPAPDREQLRGIGRDLQQLIAEIRDEIFDVKRQIDGGLRAELLDVILPMAGTFGVAVDLTTTVDRIDDATLAHEVRAVVREASSNAIRHGHASTLQVRLATVDDALVLVLRDNGVGFDPDHVPASGIANMRRRAELMGGTFEIDGAEGGGTRLCWQVPVYPGTTISRRPSSPERGMLPVALPDSRSLRPEEEGHLG